MNVRTVLMIVAACVVSASVALASTIKLKSGVTLVGEAHKLGGSYSIVMPDGSRKLVSAGEIATIDGVDPSAPAAAAASDDSAPTTGPATPGNVSASFKAVKAKADHVDAPVAAVQLWEEFIGKKPAPADLAAAQAEKAVWDKLYKDKAERIKGKWVGGKDLVDLKKKCNDMLKEAIDPGDDGVKGVNGLHKLDDIIAIYPNQFEANFYKGYYYLVQAIRTRVGSNDALAKAMVSLERTAAIAPDSPEVWCNLAIGYNFKREYQKSIEAAYRAVKMRDDDEDLVAILHTALAQSPPQMLDVNEKVRKINEDAQVLFTRYKIGGDTKWRYVRPTHRDDDRAADDAKKPVGVVWSGSGFFITSNGYFLTNRHVATGESKGAIDPALSFRIRLDDGSERAAKLIAVGDNCDIALMKVEVPRPVHFLKIAEINPNQGADAMVLGYPATGYEDMTMQISVGKVKSVNLADEWHIWFDLNTTHGNSGGPVVDKYGRVISILTAGRTMFNQTIMLGVGPDQMEVFLKDMAASQSDLKVNYETPPATPSDAPLNSEKLTIDCRDSTLLVLAIRGDGKKTPAATPADKPDAGDGR